VLVIYFLHANDISGVCGNAIAKAGSSNTLTVFTPSASPTGFSGVGLGVVFGILSFIGFDAAATLGEETRNPRRNVPLAVGGALVLVGIFYVFIMYALTVGYGLTHPANFQAFLSDPNPIVTLAHNNTPWLQQIIDLCALVGLFSCLLAIHNTTIRIIFSMGRDRVLPGWLGKVHSRWFSPYTAIIAQAIFTVVLGFAIGLWLGPGATGAYGFTGAIGTVAIVIVYMMCNIALIRYFFRLPERNWLLHIVIPILGVAALAYPLWAVAQPGQAFPYNLVPYIVIAWVGLDLGLKSMVVTSDGQTYGNPKFFAKDEKKLAKAQRRHAKKRKGSKNRDKARRKVARIHARIADRRRDYQHRLSTHIIRENQIVCVESLQVKNMVKNPRLAKAISDVGWGEFVRQLEYKARWYGRVLVKIDKFYPSSKRCFECGHVLDSLPLDIRTWTCPACGIVHDRDINAAKNIHAAGLTVFEACGEAVRPGRAKARVGKLR
jgi:IS605 OrfB family transposase